MSLVFPARQERLDWQLVAEVDLASLLAGDTSQVARLQAVLVGVAFCVPENEFGNALASAHGLAKVFRLAQLIIQYLVHCQQQLTDQLAAKEQQKKEVVEEKEKATSFANALEEEVKVLRKENKKRRKMLTAQQECLFKGTNLRDFQKCSFCPKTFINQSFLTSHLARRHGQVASKPADGGEGEVGEQLRSLVRSMKEELAVGREGRMEELTSLVRRQQEQMEKLQETLKERTEEKERRKEQPKEEVEGRMEAQERFWQAQMRNLDERMRREEEEARRREERLENQLKEERGKRERLERLKEKRRKKRKDKKKESKDQADEVAVRSEKNDAELCEEEFGKVDAQASSKPPLVEDYPRKRSGEGRGREVVDRGNTLLENEKKKSGEARKSHDNGGRPNESTVNSNAWRSPKSVETKKMPATKQVELGLDQKISEEAPVTELFSEGEEDSLSEDESENGEDGILQPAISGLSLKSDHVYEAPQSLEDLVNGLDGGVNRLEKNKELVIKALGKKMVELGLHPDTSHLSDTELKKMLAKLKVEKPLRRDLLHLRELCREEVDELAEQSVGIRRGGSLRRRMSRGVSSFRRQVFHSLQNLRHKNRQKSKLEEAAKENGEQGDTMQRRSRKKKAPEPPRFVRKPLGSPKKNNDCRAEQNINTEGASIVARACTENEYEETPRKELLRPPQPAPRKSKLPQTLSSSEEDESEEEQEEDEDEEEEEEEDLEEVKNRVQNQYYNKQTLTLVEGRQDSGRERIEKVEDENEEFSEESTLHERYNNDAKEHKSESEWDSEEEEMEAEIENIEMGEDDKIEEVDEEIKLRKPTPGSKIADLTNIIEAQLHNRVARPAGGVDPLQAAQAAAEEEDGKLSITSIDTNTLATSMWGDNSTYHSTRPPSAATPGLILSRPDSASLQMPHVRGTQRLTSWDSD